MDREIVKEESMYDFYREQTLLLTEEYKELKERIDKAIEILENIYMLKDVSITNNACNEIDKAINILKGDDKE